MKRKWIQNLPNPTNALWKNVMLYWLKLILNSDQDLAFSWQKHSYRSTSHKNLQNQNNENFFIQLLYAWLHRTNNNIPPSYLIYRRNSCPTHSFKSKHQIDFKHHPTQEYFRQIYHYLGPFCRFLLPGLISSTIFCKKLVFPTVNHKRYIELHWAQFPMIGNT